MNYKTILKLKKVKKIFQFIITFYIDLFLTFSLIYLLKFLNLYINKTLLIIVGIAFSLIRAEIKTINLQKEIVEMQIHIEQARLQNQNDLIEDSKINFNTIDFNNIDHNKFY